MYSECRVCVEQERDNATEKEGERDQDLFEGTWIVCTSELTGGMDRRRAESTLRDIFALGESNSACAGGGDTSCSVAAPSCRAAKNDATTLDVACT